jgi:hypothetical protein
MAQDESGRRRIDGARDFVALEIAAALKRDIHVIPVLVAGARMPREGDLPEQLTGLAYRTAIVLSDTGWEHQISGLVDSLSQIFESRAGTGARIAPPSTRSVATVVRQNQLDERCRRIARESPVVIGDTSAPGRARLLNALLPELQRAGASVQREAKFAHRLGLALLQSQVHALRIRLVRDDDW